MGGPRGLALATMSCDLPKTKTKTCKVAEVAAMPLLGKKPDPKEQVRKEKG